MARYLLCEKRGIVTYIKILMFEHFDRLLGPFARQLADGHNCVVLGVCELFAGGLRLPEVAHFPCLQNDL